MVVCVSLDKDNHRIFEWRSGSDVAWAETIETLQVNLKATPFIGNAWKRMVTFYWGMAFQEDSSCSLTWKAQCLNDPQRCKVWLSTNQGNSYRSNNHDLDSPEVSNFNDKKMQSRAPKHGRQPLSWTYESPCNVAWKPLPGSWPSEFIGGHHYIIVIAYVFFSDATILIRPIQTFQDHDQHAEVCGSRSMFHEICWTMWDLRHMSGLLVGFTVTADPEDCCDCRLECCSMIRENNEQATNQWERIQMKSQKVLFDWS